MYFEEKRGICLITSSSEIREDLGIEEAAGAKENGSKKTDEPTKGKDNEQLLMMETAKSAGEDKPIFVDLTTDEKNIWKQTSYLKSSCDAKPLVEDNERERGIQNPAASITISN